MILADRSQVTRCYYQHLNFQLITMIRGSLVALIFEKTMSLDASTARDNEAVTLMSADIEGIEPGVELIHEIWASVVELGVALYLLERKVGAACFFVVIPAVIASFLTSRLMRAMGPARMIWSKGIQKRVSAASNMLGHIKGLKMMGLTSYMATTIQNLRCNELEVSKKFRLALIRILTTSTTLFLSTLKHALIQYGTRQSFIPVDARSCNRGRCFLDKAWTGSGTQYRGYLFHPGNCILGLRTRVTAHIMPAKRHGLCRLLRSHPGVPASYRAARHQKEL